MPDPLPANPLALAAQWLAQARSDAAQPNPDSMILATVDAAAIPSARVVLCKEIDAPAGFILFYTNYQSRKGRELKMNPRAAVVFHWDHRHRQVRAEGRVEQLSDAENDAYFRTRPWQSRIGAWASQQSEPVQSRAVLAASVAARPAASGFLMAGRERRSPRTSVPRCPAPPIGAAIACAWTPWNCGWRGNFAFTTARAGRERADLKQDVDAATTWSVSRLQP